MVHSTRLKEIPASFAQSRLWFAQEMGTSGLEFIYPYVQELRGPLNVRVLDLALHAVVARHEILRTTYRTRDGVVLQSVRPAPSSVLRTVPMEEVSRTGSDAVVADFLSRPFDLETDPMIRALLLPVGDDHHLLAIVVHHIATDGWSMDVLFDELSQTYSGLCAGLASDLPALDHQYADFATWEVESHLTGEFDDDLAFWRSALTGVPTPIALPFDRPREAEQSFAGATSGFAIEPEQVAALDRVAKSCGASRFMALLAVFAVTTARWSRQHEFIVGVPHVNRELPSWQNLIGFFMNLMPVPVRVNLSDSFAALIRGVRELMLDSVEHGAVSFDRIVESVAPTRSAAHHPLVQITFNRETMPSLDLPGIVCSPRHTPTTHTRYELAFDYVEQDSGGVLFDVSFATDLFDPATVEALIEQFQACLDALVHNPDTPMGSLPLQSPDREAAVLALGSGDPLRDGDRDPVAGFERVVRSAPARNAVVAGDHTVTFGELGERVRAITSGLRGAGVRSGRTVAVLGGRDVDHLAAIFAILGAGAVYLPIDPAYPADRIDYLLDDADPAAVIDLVGVVREVPAGTSRTVHDVAGLIELGGTPRSSSFDRDEPPSSATSGYCIYTSGSTGRPKPVFVSRRSLGNTFAGLEQSGAYPPPPARVGWNASPSFDAAVQQWMRLGRGDTIVLIDDDTRRDPARLGHELIRHGVTDLDITPSHLLPLLSEFENLPEETRRNLRLWVGGEAIDPFLWERMVRVTRAGGPTFMNLYGTTETTVDTSCTPVDGSVPDVGRVLPGQSLVLVDEFLCPVPVGLTGEVVIRGASVAEGYLGRPGLTASRFVPDPWASDGSRMYRTGDLARWTPGRTMEYRGRMDHQVKIRGYRIELGEIEQSLMRLPGVVNAAVVVRATAGDQALTAFLEAGADITAEVVREHLHRELPEWMVPAVVEIRDSLPQTAAGKLDRETLTAWTGPEPPVAAAPTAASTTERLLIEVWSEVLGRQDITSDSNFFDLGGHSLLAIRVVARLKKQTKVNVPMTVVFTNPRLRDLAAAVETAFSKRGDA